MRVKLEWLNELVDLTGLSLEDIVNTVSLHSIEVENVDRMIKASNIVIGHVLTKAPHPDSDHLNLLTVDVGDEVLNIVCGAPNVDKDQYVIIAKVGAKLPGGEIKKSKIRGYESCGMCCSLQELGIENKYIPEKFANGIYYFEDYKPALGKDAAEALNLRDEVLELGITPNRGDLLSMIGCAYEFSAAFNRPLKPLVYEVLREKSDEALDIKIETDKCTGYYGQIIRDVKIKESPRWLKSRLIAFGIRAINNCVDITNYVLALFGQPLHAFDLDKLGHKIVIKNAKAGEKFVSLDEIERELKDTDIAITDGNKTQCLGGVMGGLESEITDTTQNIMLEAAVFDPLTIRKTAARLNLHSESSNRYERGVDINRTKQALDYACYLYKELADAKIVGEAYFAGTTSIPDKEILLTKENVNKRLGTNISTKEIKEILESLNFKVEATKDTLKVYVPNRRSDITIKEDLVEEVIRLYGYDKLEDTIPCDSQAGELRIENKNKRLIQDTLSGLGFNEAITYSLVSDTTNKEFAVLRNEKAEDIKILMPITEERCILRTTLIPSLLNVIKYNLSRKIKDIADFEISKTYYKVDGVIEEELHLGIAITGTYSSSLWQGKKENVDFFLLKGVLEEVFKKLSLYVTYKAIDIKCNELHPNRTALLYLGEDLIGYAGQVHPEYAHKNDLEEVYVAEINLSKFIGKEKNAIHYQQIAKLPSVERDIALVMAKDIKASDVVECILHADKQYLKDAIIFDLYQGDKIESDKKSIAVKLIFSSDEALTDDIINAKVKRILKDLQYKLNITLRQ